MKKIEVIVKTNSKENKIIFKDSVYHVYTKSPAKEGKANKEIIDLLSKYMDIPKSSIVIELGIKSKYKVVRIME